VLTDPPGTPRGYPAWDLLRVARNPGDVVAAVRAAVRSAEVIHALEDKGPGRAAVACAEAHEYADLVASVRSVLHRPYMAAVAAEAIGPRFTCAFVAAACGLVRARHGGAGVAQVVQAAAPLCVDLREHAGVVAAELTPAQRVVCEGALAGAQEESVREWLEGTRARARAAADGLNGGAGGAGGGGGGGAGAGAGSLERGGKGGGVLACLRLPPRAPPAAGRGGMSGRAAGPPSPQRGGMRPQLGGGGAGGGGGVEMV